MSLKCLNEIKEGNQVVLMAQNTFMVQRSQPDISSKSYNRETALVARVKPAK
jgi:hypothetical protein